jgi:hypothetical protein
MDRDVARALLLTLKQLVMKISVRFRNLSTLLFIPFAILMLTLNFFHEPWRDELQGFGFVSKATSLHESFLEFLSTGSLPPYWFIYTLFAEIGSYEYKKWFFCSIVLLAAYLFMRIKQIKLIHKVPLLLSPYVFFEWGTIHRIYTLILIISLLVLYQLSKNVSSYWIVFSLASLSMLGFWGIFMATVFSITIAVFSRILNLKHLIFVSICILVGCMPYFLNINSGYSVQYSKNVDFSNPLGKLLSTTRNLYILLYGNSAGDENSWVRIWPESTPYSDGILTIIILVISVLTYALVLDKKLFIILAITGCMFYTWTSFFYPGAPRHWFYLPFSWVMIGLTYRLASIKPNRHAGSLGFLRRITGASVIVLISLQIVSQVPYTVRLVSADIKLPFSSIHELTFSEDYRGTLMIFPDYLGVTFLAQRDTDALFLEGNYFGSFHEYQNSRDLNSIELSKRCFTESSKLTMLTSKEISDRLQQSQIGDIRQTSGSAIVSEEGNVSLVSIKELCTKSEWSNFLKILQD